MNKIILNINTTHNKKINSVYQIIFIAIKDYCIKYNIKIIHCKI